MNRIKVINEPSELVPMLRSVDTVVKRDVLKEVTLEWRTADEIEEKFGPEGREAIIFFLINFRRIFFAKTLPVRI